MKEINKGNEDIEEWIISLTPAFERIVNRNVYFETSNLLCTSTKSY